MAAAAAVVVGDVCSDRSVSPQASEVPTVQEDSAEEVMLKVAAHTHYLPEHWLGKAHTVEVRSELLGLFHYKAQLFLEVCMSARMYI